MPKAVSKKQLRMMHAIAAGYHIETRRGDSGPPKKIAQGYVDAGHDDDDEKSLPESKGKEHEGGQWTHEHKKNHAEGKSTKRKHHRRAIKKSLTKSKHEHKAAAMIVLNSNNQILLGKHVDGGLAFPGGHIDDSDLDAQTAAIRETKEEAGLVVNGAQKMWSSPSEPSCEVFIANSYTGEPEASDELKNLKWYDANEIPWDKVRECCIKPLEYFVKYKLGKSLKSMLALEALEKNIVREKGGAVHEMTHGDSLKLIGTGLFRKLKQEVAKMSDEDFKDIKLDTHVLKIRKHMNDVYSGSVVDGHKTRYQFTNKSLPEVTAALMSVFEWYLPEDEEVLNIIDEDISDDDIHGGIKNLIDEYRKHNIGNIYEEMENIRKEIRDGAAIDVQQVESRIMKLFDKLEETIHTVVDKHNTLTKLTEKEIEELEAKLRDMQSKLDQISKKPETIEAISVHKQNPEKIHREEYPYLPKPQIEISADGKIKITFQSEWTSLEKENFLHDLRAKVIGKKEKK